MTSYYVNLPEELQALKADEVITLLTYMNINGEIVAMTRTESPDDVPWAEADPQFFAQSPEELEKNFGPLHRAFLAWTATAPAAVRAWVRPDAEGTHLILLKGNAFDEPIEDPAYRAWLMKIHSKILDAAVKKAKLDHTKLIEVLLPLRNQLAPGENLGGGLVRSDSTLANWMDADLEAAANSRGVLFINLTPALRSMEPSLFPLVGYATHHYRTQGVNWAALATAMSYVDRLP
jgi:hypothetical protein